MSRATIDVVISSIDHSGRVPIPKPIRRCSGLRPGQPVEIRFRDGRVEIEPATVPVRIERRGRVAVAVPEEPVPPLTAEEIERIRDECRFEQRCPPIEAGDD